MTNRFVCTKCRRNITEIELSTSRSVRTRYDDRIHTFCPSCDKHIVSITDDIYNKCFTHLSKQFMMFGCRLMCYYEGEVVKESNVVEYHPPIFRILDDEDRYFFNIVSRLKESYDDEILADTSIINEGDGSFSVIVGTETWYFDKERALEDQKSHLQLLNKIITILIKCGKKHYANIYRYE